MSTPASALYVGAVVHTRLRPRRHRLRYRLFTLYLDLDEIDALDRKLMFFSRGRFNLFSFYDRDHGDGSEMPLRRQIETMLTRFGLSFEPGPIRLVCMPRMLGYVFNPISVYFCHARGGALRAMVYEVNNTFGERHCYVVPVEGESAIIRQSCEKQFHVSPFMDVDMVYDFRTRIPDENLSLGIVGRDAQGPIIVAGLTGKRRVATDSALAKVFCQYPLLTLSVIAAIHWEALKLLLKGVGLRAHRPAPRHSATAGTSRPAGIG